jgi:paraquat-inducible protein B
MAETEDPPGSQSRSSHDEVREAVVEEHRRASLVWVIPIVAALVGAWLAYHSYSERGPAITITFETADGLEAGKTKVKYKDVEVGLVESIELSDDLSHVVVAARLVKGSARYLTDQTRFWVVRASVSAGRVSGLGTLFSGAYIGIEPATEGDAARSFTGLDIPPVVTSDQPGEHFTLRAEGLGSVQIGSPVYFHWVEVGQIVAYELDESGNHVTIQVFVRAPHDQRVSSATQFWNASGFDLSIDADGVELDTVSLTALLIGGIAFDTPPGAQRGVPVEKGVVFPLYANYRATKQPHITVRHRFLVQFDQSVGGLEPGAPVNFRGIQIGEVLDVKLVLDTKTQTPRIPVLIEVQPERISVQEGPTGDLKERWTSLVARGMRAQLQTGNILTGKLEIALDFHPEAPPGEIDWSGPVPELPTVPSPIEELKTGLANFIQRLDRLPMEQIGANLNSLLAELRTLSHSMNAELVPSLAATLDNAERALASADSLIAPDAEASRELRRMLLELTEAAQAIRLLAEQLEQHPESLIRGKEAGQ